MSERKKHCCATAFDSGENAKKRKLQKEAEEKQAIESGLPLPKKSRGKKAQPKSAAGAGDQEPEEHLPEEWPEDEPGFNFVVVG